MRRFFMYCIVMFLENNICNTILVCTSAMQIYRNKSERILVKVPKTGEFKIVASF